MMCRCENKNTDWKGDWRRGDLKKPVQRPPCAGKWGDQWPSLRFCILHIKMNFKAQDSIFVRIKFSVSDRNPQRTKTEII